MKNIFLVTSCMQPTFGVINLEDRYKQTLETFESIRNKTEDSFIVFTDSSVIPIEQHKIDNIKSKVDMYLDLSKDQQAQQTYEQSETALL